MLTISIEGYMKYRDTYMTGFIAHGLALLSAAFSLGGISNLYIRYRTRVLPHLVSTLVSLPLSRTVKVLLWVWNSVFFLFGVTAFLFPAATGVTYSLLIQQLATILGSLIFMGVGFRQVRNPWWRKAFLTFFVMSTVFLLLLIADVLITLVPIPALLAFDNLSLPVYLAALNAGTFIFSGRFLSRDALVEHGRLTENCIEFYHLTPREVEIVAELIQGHTNKEIGERLFISAKIVENHLYSIYQKIDVRTRMQLIQTLHTWETK